MSWLMELLGALDGLPVAVMLATAAGLAFSETGLGLGVAVPGETGVLLLATTVDTRGEFAALGGAVWLGAAAGDSFSYALGRRYGVRVRDLKFMRAATDRWDRASSLLRRHGMAAVLIGRFLPVVRALIPAAAGTSRMGYPRFAAASVTGALAWSVTHVAVGAFAGASLSYIEDVVGAAGWIALGLVLAILTLVWLYRRHRPRSAGAKTRTTEHTVYRSP